MEIVILGGKKTTTEPRHFEVSKILSRRGDVKNVE
jgi:hypothetical protein